VIEGLIKYLKSEGFSVATIKHTSHSHKFDTPGKDTHRHRVAGAALTVAMSKGEWAIFAEPESIDIQKLSQIAHQSIDIWLVEGDREADRPKIMVTREMDESSGKLPENIVATIGPERIRDIPVHFEDKDYMGLGAFVKEILSKQNEEIKN
jgi:molybdopterin-guanine dinucleotide biosynthesis protein MobB